MTTTAIRALCLAALAALAGAGDPSADDSVRPVKAITAPSKDLTLAFTRQGQIAQVLVREGQRVRAGQVLARLEDSVERTQVSLLKAKADDTSAVRAAEVQLVRAKRIVKRVQKAYAEQAAPESELEEARTAEALAELAFQQARLDHQLDQVKHQEAQLALDRMRLLSPADAEVERVPVETGEAVDALAPVLRLVQTDPLWIDAPVPLALARKLAPGDAAAVRFASDGAGAKGKVIRVRRVADAASMTLEVRVELPNPARRPAGEQVSLRFAPRTRASGVSPGAKKKTPG